MRLGNTSQTYGAISVLLHWLVAVLVVGLYFLGDYMVDLGYYDTWYTKGPLLHEALGAIVGILLMARIVWRVINPVPALEANSTAWQRLAAHGAHLSLYVLMVGIIVSGYLITTGDGRSVDVFGWFQIPSVLGGVSNGIFGGLLGDVKHLQDRAGEVHEIFAVTLMGLTVIHALAALKHHFVDRDRTLLRMLGIGIGIGRANQSPAPSPPTMAPTLSTNNPGQNFPRTKLLNKTTEQTR